MLEQNDDIIYQQQYVHDLKDPIACYMKNFISSKPRSCNNYKVESETNFKVEIHVPSFVDDKESVMSFLQYDASVQ